MFKGVELCQHDSPASVVSISKKGIIIKFSPKRDEPRIKKIIAQINAEDLGRKIKESKKKIKENSYEECRSLTGSDGVTLNEKTGLIITGHHLQGNAYFSAFIHFRALIGLSPVNRGIYLPLKEIEKALALVKN